MIKYIIAFKQRGQGDVRGLKQPLDDPVPGFFNPSILRSDVLWVRAVTVARSRGPSRGIISTDLGCSIVNDNVLYHSLKTNREGQPFDSHQPFAIALDIARRGSFSLKSSLQRAQRHSVDSAELAS
jgi:hypothetical protein